MRKPQDIFAYYKQPFAVTYLGASLLVVYLPVAFLKDWTCNLLKRQSSKSGNDAASVNGSSDELSSPLSRKIIEIELQGTLTKKDSELDLASTEEGNPLVSRHKDDLNALKHDKELTTRENDLKEDYDLCSICFAAMGNEADFIKMDRPV
ncbi:hypothetical protein OIU77_007066, partial [Salix suchowensis]